MPPRVAPNVDDSKLSGQIHPGDGNMGHNSNGSNKRPRDEEDELDDDDEDEGGKKERRKIEIAFIKDKSRRHITFSKRKAGIMKKAYELSVLTGTQVLLLVVSETGLVYTFTTPKLQPLVTKPEGKNLIQSCLNAPEPSGGSNDEDSPDLTASPIPTTTVKQQRSNSGSRTNTSSNPPSRQQSMPISSLPPPQAANTASAYHPPYNPEQAAAYQQYLQNQNSGAGGYRP